MSTIYKGVNAAKLAQTIPALAEQGQFGGKLRTMYDSFVLTADFASGDTLVMGELLPEGALLLDAVLTTGALGGSCTLNVGWKAGAAGLEAAAPTGFVSAIAVSSAEVIKCHGATGEGTFYGYVLKEAVQPVIAENAVSSGATGVAISLEIKYLVD